MLITLSSTLFLLQGLLSRFGSLGRAFLLGNILDYTNSNGLLHITDSKTTKGRVFLEGLHTHGLAWDHLNDAGVTRLDKLGGGLKLLTSTSVDLGLQFSESAGNMCGVAIQHRRVSSLDLSRVVKDNNLGKEAVGLLGWVILGVRGDEATLQILDRDVLHVETNIVTRVSLSKSFVVHLNRLNFSGGPIRSEAHNHTRLDLTSLNTANRHCSNATNLVHILEGKTEGLVYRAAGRFNVVKGIKQSFKFIAARLALDLLFLPPGHVRRLLQHVVSVEARDGHNGDSGWVVSNLLDIGRDFLANFLETSLGVFGLSAVHLVDGNNDLLDTKGEAQEHVLTGLTILGDTSLKLTSTSSNNQHGTISL